MPSYYMDASKKCVACPSGFYSYGGSDTTCTQCPANKYVNADGNGCSACPAGTTSAPGSDSVSDCAADPTAFYVDVPGVAQQDCYMTNTKPYCGAADGSCNAAANAYCQASDLAVGYSVKAINAVGSFVTQDMYQTGCSKYGYYEWKGTVSCQRV
jgi:hypothetical protein